MRRYRQLGALGVLAIGVAFAQNASGPWTVTLTPPNPLRIGICGAVQLTVLNASGTDVPRNKQGQRISVADFDMSVSGASVAGRKIDDYHYEVCGCQGAVPGTVAKVKAIYPAKALPAAAVVDNVHIEREASFSVGAVIGQGNPPACTAPPPTPPASATPSAPAPAAPSAPATPSAPPASPAPAPSPPPASAPAPAPAPPATAAMPDMPGEPDPATPTAMPGLGQFPTEPPPAPVEASKDEDPLAMFAALMPVFKSPRCVNCHGGTNPDQDLNHPGGQQDVPSDASGDMLPVGLGSNESCVGCHDAEAARFWKLAPKRFSFVGKDTLPLCRQLRSGPQHTFNLNVTSGRGKFLEHLRTDELIGVAFVGNGGVSDEPAVPPPMSHQKFLALARHWLEDGEGACANDWSGTITETIAAQQKASFAPAAGGRVVKTDTRIAITVAKSKAAGVVTLDMRDLTDVPTPQCATYTHQSWSALSNNLPVQFTAMARDPSTRKSSSPAVPSAFTLPAGVTLPPGVTLPTDMGVPGIGESFFRYMATTAVAGHHRSDIRSLPGCRQTVAEDKYGYHLEGAMLALVAAPGDPNKYKGQKVINIAGGTRTIAWDLTHVRE